MSGGEWWWLGAFEECWCFSPVADYDYAGLVIYVGFVVFLSIFVVGDELAVNPLVEHIAHGSGCGGLVHDASYADGIIVCERILKHGQ